MSVKEEILEALNKRFPDNTIALTEKDNVVFDSFILDTTIPSVERISTSDRYRHILKAVVIALQYSIEDEIKDFT